jgi:hypothetical protein
LCFSPRWSKVGNTTHFGDQNSSSETRRLCTLIPDGDCDDDCEDRIAASQNNTEPAQFPATMMLGSESLFSPVERYRNMMRHRYHLPANQRLRAISFGSATILARAKLLIGISIRPGL